MGHYQTVWSSISFVLVATFSLFECEIRAAQEVAKRLEPSLRISRDTKYVSCWNKKQEQTNSLLVRSPILTSKDGLRRAYVEVEAIAFQPKDPASYTGSLCANTSRLFLAGPGDADFKLAYSQAQDFSDGNSLKLVDWSPDGNYLVMERTIWKYESEGDYTDLVLFSVSSRAVVPDLSKILERQFGKDCGSENAVIGFTPEGNVAVLVAPLDDTYYNEGATSCVKQKTLLALDAKRGLQHIADMLPGNFTAQKYGRFAEPTPPKK